MKPFPEGQPAQLTPEERGLGRDGVRLLISHSRGEEHAHFLNLPSWLRQGDLLIFNSKLAPPAYSA